jgi:hypothetical protein
VAEVRTLLEQLIHDSDHTIEEWYEQFQRTARLLGERNAELSVRQLQRWMAGHVGKARPAAGRVATQLWKHPVKELLAPPNTAQTATPAPSGASGGGTFVPMLTSASSTRASAVAEVAYWPSDSGPRPAGFLHGVAAPGASPAFRVEEEVLMTAHGSSDHAEQAERREIGEATLEQLRADVTRLAREFFAVAPMTMFQELRRVRDRINTALDRKLWPRDQTELYFLLGCLHNLMAVDAQFLGYRQAGEELLRAGWAYATMIDHRPLMARLRFELAVNAHWRGMHRECLSISLSGLDYLADGQDAAALHLLAAQASADLGDAGSARTAINAAHEARERETSNELLEIGGEFGLSRASQHHLAGSALLAVPDAAESAASELAQAKDLYDAGPGPGEWHSFEYRALTQVNLTVAHLRAGELDAALTAAEPALSLPPDQRVDSLLDQLRLVRQELATPTYQHQTQATTLDERIEDYTRDSITDDFASLATPAR